MKRYNNSFRFKLIDLDFETIENSPHSIFGLSTDLKIIYFNKAWLEFSKLNNGEPGISTRFKIGTSIELALNGEIKDYYITNYKKVLQNLKVWKHEYECSSPELYREFYQDVYPLKNGKGIIIVNSLKTERSFNKGEREESTLSEKEYLDKDGIITQCTNCRKTRRANDVNTWDWVPSLVSSIPTNISHSICVICYDYFWKYRRL